MTGKKYIIKNMFELKTCQKNLTKKEFFDRFELSFEMSMKLIARDAMLDSIEFDRIMTAEEFKLRNHEQASYI